ncbi:MAG: nicotinate-nucleotide adenylyltransferase [Hyphomicrobiaceae bacterium]|nr:nicotinate-nucleotide adenylyltransferase [Hyphomicrobiaceae bacterium]
MSIGLLGGTFDPPHAGHVHISEMALKRLGLDRLWWLVTPGNPLKSPSDMKSFASRLHAARALVRHPRIDVTGFEVATGSAYTADTIAYLRRRYPCTRFVWIMGADNLASFHLWRRNREIMEGVPIAVMDRPGYRLAACASRTSHRFANAYLEETDASGLKSMTPPAWTFLTVPLSSLSSTALREAGLNHN